MKSMRLRWKSPCRRLLSLEGEETIILVVGVDIEVDIEIEGTAEEVALTAAIVEIGIIAVVEGFTSD